MELAIAGLFTRDTSGNAKAVYIAPTKSLCAERAADWNKRFASAGLRCAELTGDSDAGGIYEVRSAHLM